MTIRPSKNRKSALRKADEWFSKYIRLRDSDENGWGSCCTCGRRHHWKEMNAGHFVPRGRMGTRFDEKNVHIQCVYCNRFLEGQQFKHGQHIDWLYGKGTAERLIERGHTLYKVGIKDLDEIATKYNALAKGLMKEKGLE